MVVKPHDDMIISDTYIRNKDFKYTNAYEENFDIIMS